MEVDRVELRLQDLVSERTRTQGNEGLGLAPCGGQAGQFLGEGGSIFN